MSKQDRQGVRTANQLEQKYKFGGIAENEQKTSQQSEKVSQLSQTVSQLNTSMNGKFAEVEEKLDSVLEEVYPVGSVYISVSTDAPAFGGEWELFAEGQIIVGTSDPESEGLMSVMQPYTTCDMWKRTA